MEIDLNRVARVQLAVISFSCSPIRNTSQRQVTERREAHKSVASLQRRLAEVTAITASIGGRANATSLQQSVFGICVVCQQVKEQM